MSDIQRFDIPAKGTMIEGYRAFRAYLEKVAASEGKALDPVWYRDSPEQLPEMYDDQPDVFAAIQKKNETERLSRGGRDG